MEYTAEVYSAYCALRTFVINGVSANEDEFVTKYDKSPQTAEDYGCGNMQADTISPTEAVLSKYGITEAEFDTIAQDVAEKLSFGYCGWCI